MIIKSLDLGVAINTNSSTVISATLTGAVDVTLGFDDLTTSYVVIELEDGAMSLDAALLIKASVELGPLLLTAARFSLR